MGRLRNFAALAAADPEIIIAGCCGWPQRRTAERLAELAAEPRWQQLRAVAAGNVHAVDANQRYTSPGPSILDAVEELANIFRACYPRPIAARDFLPG